jgi:diguanylate cyclase (GGDEF)-like protein
MDDQLHQAIADACRKNRLVGLLFFDLNRFRKIIETLGHPMGDELLKQITCRMSKRIRQSDRLARGNNDNFMIILKDVGTTTNVLQVEHKLLDVLKVLYQIKNHERYIDASIGIGVYPGDGDDVEALNKNADTASAFAKAGGKSQVESYEPAMSTLAMERLQIAN